MSAPFFSIIIPTLNEEEALPHLILDLMHQKYSLFEILIVDGGSTDGTSEAIKPMLKKDGRFKLIQSKKQNVSSQRNLGVKKAAGKWVIFLDADSRVEKNFLETLKSQLMKYTCDGFTCYAVADTTAIDAIAYVQLQNVLLETMATLGTPYSVGACMGCKRKVFEKIGGFDSRIHHMEDSELSKRMHEKGYVFKVLRRPTYVFSLRRQRKEGKLTMMKKLFPYYIKSVVSNEFSTPEKTIPDERGDEMTKVSCVIPTYNEEKRIQNVLTAVMNASLVDEVIVVDGSSDHTSDIVRKNPTALLIEQHPNQGKAAA